MDDGESPIADPAERAALKKRAVTVVVVAVATAIALTGLLLTVG